MSYSTSPHAEPRPEGTRLDHVWDELSLELQGRALQLLVRLALHWVRQPEPSLTPEVRHETPSGEYQDPA